MLTLSAIVPEIVGSHPFLQYGVQHRIFNLSQLAKHIRPLVELRAKKHVTESAIVMALSRHQRRASKVGMRQEEFHIEKLTVHTGLCTFSYTKTDDLPRKVHQLHTAVLRKSGYITLSEGTREITVIVDAAYAPLVRTLVGPHPKYFHARIAAVGVHFSARYVDVPGPLCIILQQIWLQHINVREVASTLTEFVLYIDEANTKLAFDTLYQLFGQKRGLIEKHNLP
ncbi:hypothetical protein HY213_01255 [Candidatus Peregrinibacteria bacterium]|nr:hypothetical protein [Candidatus Peregrinibacteria bacterium]